MSDRCAQIAADVAKASAAFLPEGASEPQVTRVEEEDDAVCFDVEGFGEFSAFMPEPYPGDTTVYGPDDLVLEHSGTVLEVIAGTLADLRRKLGGRAGSKAARLEAPTPPTLDRMSSLESDAVDTGDAGDIGYDVQEEPMPPLLADHLRLVQRVLGASAADCAEMSNGWRVRLRVNLNAVSGALAGEALISHTTGKAWGIDPDLPLTIELQIPQSGYMSETMPDDVVKSVWQEGFPGFLPEKQLVTILNDFTNIVLGRELNSCSASASEAEFSPEQLQVIQQYDAKKAEMVSAAENEQDLGFLGQLAAYTQARVTTLHEYCALCDQSFGLPPMMLRTVCTRELCSHQFAAFGEKITSAEGVNTQAEIAELLVFMLARAAESHRKELVVDPYPCVFGGASGKEHIFHPSKKDFKKLQDCITQLANLRMEAGPSSGAAWTALTQRMTVAGAGLVRWVIASNRTYLAPVRDEQRIRAFGTNYQYLLISAPPEKEAKFQKLKEKHGSTFAFHGSHLGNWHSILRNGLKNASNTPLMSTGAAHGPGIYMGKSSQVSLGYCSATPQPRSKVAQPAEPPALTRHITGNRFLENDASVAMLAVCEVVKAKSLKEFDWGYVAPDEETVCTRFFLVLTKTSMANVVLTDQVISEINALMVQLGVGRDVPVGQAALC